MNLKLRLLLPISLLVLSGGMIKAQDFHLSQYDAAPLNLNPSMTGLFEGYYRVHAHYRTQWQAIAQNPFQTFAASFDMPLDKWGLGGQVMDYRAGAGNYNVFSFLLSGSYDFALDKEKNHHHISTGLQLGFIQKSIQFSKLVWDNQYTYANGGGFDNTIPHNEPYGDNGLVMPDLNAGFVYFYSNDKSRLNPFVGFSAAHLTQPNESFYSQKNKLPIRWEIHAGSRVSINQKLQLQPKFYIKRQVNDREFTVSMLANYYMKDYDAFLIFGPTFRISGPLTPKTNYYDSEKDAAIIELGLKMGPFVYRISYDINTSTLQPYTDNRGGFEISVTYIGRRGKPETIDNCPRL